MRLDVYAVIRIRVPGTALVPPNATVCGGGRCNRLYRNTPKDIFYAVFGSVVELVMSSLYSRDYIGTI